MSVIYARQVMVIMFLSFRTSIGLAGFYSVFGFSLKNVSLTTE